MYYNQTQKLVTEANSDLAIYAGTMNEFVFIVIKHFINSETWQYPSFITWKHVLIVKTMPIREDHRGWRQRVHCGHWATLYTVLKTVPFLYSPPTHGSILCTVLSSVCLNFCSAPCCLLFARTSTEPGQESLLLLTRAPSWLKMKRMPRSTGLCDCGSQDFSLHLQATTPRGTPGKSGRHHLVQVCPYRQQYFRRTNILWHPTGKNDYICLHVMLGKGFSFICVASSVLLEQWRKLYSVECESYTFSDYTDDPRPCFSYLCSHRWIRFLQQVPKFLPFLWAAGVIKLLSLSLAHSLCLPPQFFVHLLFLLMVSGLAAGFQVNLIDAPVIKLLAKRERTHFFHHVELSGPVEV